MPPNAHHASTVSIEVFGEFDGRLLTRERRFEATPRQSRQHTPPKLDMLLPGVPFPLRPIPKVDKFVPFSQGERPKLTCKHRLRGKVSTVAVEVFGEFDGRLGSARERRFEARDAPRRQHVPPPAMREASHRLILSTLSVQLPVML